MKTLVLVSLIALAACNNPDTETSNDKKNRTTTKSPLLKNTLEERRLNGQVKTVRYYFIDNIYHDENGKLISKNAENDSYTFTDEYDKSGYILSATVYHKKILIKSTKYSRPDKNNTIIHITSPLGANGMFKITYTDDYNLIAKTYTITGKDTVQTLSSEEAYYKDVDSVSVKSIEYDNGVQTKKTNEERTVTIKGDTTTTTRNIDGKITIIKTVILEKDAHQNPVKVLLQNPDGDVLTIYSYEYY